MLRSPVGTVSARTVAVSLTVAFLALHLVSVSVPSGGCPDGACIFDEAYYVPAAKSLLEGEATNNEHPPLAKLAIAASIWALGDNPLGWRIYSVVTGSLSILLVYLICSEMGRKDVGLLASAFLALENMFYVHSSAALLDVPAIFFSMLAVYLYLNDRFYLSAFSGAVAALNKFQAVWVLAGLVTFMVLRSVFRERQEGGLLSDEVLDSVRDALVYTAYSAVLFLSFLAFYDFAFAAFPTPIHHLSHMLTSYASLSGPFPSGAVYPWEWLVNFEPMSYYVQSVIVNGHKEVEIGFYGYGNMPIWWSAWFSTPILAFEVVRGEEKDLPLLGVSWFLWAYLPYFLLVFLFNRVTYPFYLIFGIPALAIGLSWMVNMLEGKTRLALATVLLVILGIWFIRLFPVRTFLVG